MASDLHLTGHVAAESERIVATLFEWLRIPPIDRRDAPNERMVVDQFWKGLLAAGELLIELGRLHG